MPREVIMALKIESWDTPEEVLGRVPSVAASLATTLLNRYSFEEQYELLRKKVGQAICASSDEGVQVLLHIIREAMREFVTKVNAARAGTKDFLSPAQIQAGVDFMYRSYLSELFWELPSRPGYSDAGRVSLMVDTKVRIFRELIREWTSASTPSSRHAFRRAIAMGWPEQSMSEHQRLIEERDPIECKAVGRFVGAEEQKRYVAVVRECLGCFGVYPYKGVTADSVFGPWLAEKHVPGEIEDLLVVARAKAGGVATARRDIDYATLMDGISSSGVAMLRSVAGSFRRWQTDVDAVFERITKLSAGNDDELKYRKNLQREFDVLAPDSIRIQVCAGWEHHARLSAMHRDAQAAIEHVKSVGMLRGCSVELCVYLRNDESASIRVFWEKETVE